MKRTKGVKKDLDESLDEETKEKARELFGKDEEEQMDHSEMNDHDNRIRDGIRYVLKYNASFKDARKWFDRLDHIDQLRAYIWMLENYQEADWSSTPLNYLYTEKEHAF